MNDSLVRMVGTGACTEINDTRFGLIVPDKDRAIFVPEECVVDCEKSGFRRRELTNSEKLGRIRDAIAGLDDGEAKSIMLEAHKQTQVALWRAIQAREAAASQSSSATVSSSAA